MSLDQLLDFWEKLGERERKVTLTFMARLYAGQRKYGKLESAKKDWAYEAIEEALDASVYLAAMLNDKSEKAYDSMVADAEKEAQNYTSAELTFDPVWPDGTQSDR